jgi:hypothetical protein
MMNKEQVQDELRKFSKEELVIMLSATLEIFVDEDKYEELITRSRQLFDKE